MKRSLLIGVTGVLAAAFAVAAPVCAAQPYPTKPIRVIVASGAGGGLDFVARLVGPKLSENLRQNVVVDNRAGASGSIAAELTAQATPDGYTLIMLSVASVYSHVRSQKLRALAIASAARAKAAPELPTMIESGVPGFAVTQWHGLLAPRGTPRGVIERLHREIVAVLQHPEIVSRLAVDGTEGVGSSPEQFAAHLKSEYETWARVARQTGLRSD